MTVSARVTLCDQPSEAWSVSKSSKESLKARKGKETDSLLEPPEGRQFR